MLEEVREMTSPVYLSWLKIAHMYTHTHSLQLAKPNSIHPLQNTNSTGNITNSRLHGRRECCKLRTHRGRPQLYTVEIQRSLYLLLAMQASFFLYLCLICFVHQYNSFIYSWRISYMQTMYVNHIHLPFLSLTPPASLSTTPSQHHVLFFF